jgi:hypothetical protein
MPVDLAATKDSALLATDDEGAGPSGEYGIPQTDNAGFRRSPVGVFRSAAITSLREPVLF